MSETMEKLLARREHVPKVCIIDLDRTLWNVFAAEETFPPYRRVGECEVKDSKGRSVSLHADTPAILTSLKEKGCRIAIASLSPNFELCCMLLSAFGILRLIERSLIQIKNGTGKLEHFRSIKSASGCAYQEMMFFDDLPSNVKQAQKLGITSVLVGREGLSSSTLCKGLSLFADCKRSTNVMSSWLVRAAASKEGGGGEGERVKRANEGACMEAGNANKRRSSEEKRGEKSENEEAKRNEERRNEEGRSEERRDETSGQETSDASRTKAEEGGEGRVTVRKRYEEDMSPYPREEQHRLGVPSLREKNDE
ncbi:hypothetical protein GUITHDRAFT_106356 [Guillardia theta CCMP2712]|uniref:Magnesium-dependent phosphatase-1 n=2 Tax=Guillardia theta TaxID=55529 RepID=L1JHM8_GUITC|nr:hypothetical protein GUITHDRAFT_106356 [Guillardia theta CCMP2712]EKX47802.1 hypothetical protein GUITHDRAFT_106356 [Guillardia theta CCMP2712]|eukprot:XP_005834782.1 hypothetical protein GUITHDRAFT_106356 [Guillardia theta CCMP2712]